MSRPNPFRPTRLLEKPYSFQAFWQSHQQAERQVPNEFMTAVETISEAVHALMQRSQRSPSRSESLERREVFLGPAEVPEGTDPQEGPVTPVSFPLEWGLLIGLLGVALYASAY